MLLKHVCFYFLFSFGYQANIKTSVHFRACVNVRPTGGWQAKGSTLSHPRLPSPHLSKTAKALGKKAPWCQYIKTATEERERCYPWVAT